MCGNVILALGGRHDLSAGPPMFGNTDTVEAYPISTGIWVTGLSPMPSAKSEHGAVSHGGRVYVMGSGVFGEEADFNEALTCSSLFNNKK